MLVLKYKNGEEYYNKIYFLFNLFIALSLVPFSYLLLQRQSGQLTLAISNSWHIPIAVSSLLLASAAIIFQSMKTFRLSLAIIREEDSLKKKLNLYYKQSIKKYFAFLLSSLLCVGGLYLTVSAFFIIGYITCIILLSIKRPTLNSIIKDLNLSKIEEKILIEKKSID